MKNSSIFQDSLIKESKEKAVFEKRKWAGLTSCCNNNCRFCLDGDNKKRGTKTIEQIKQELGEGVKEGCTRLVLSGGEPTIHPDFLEIIRLGKELGYKKVQVITNGRMFSYKNFLKKAISNGLDEITFSIHGHNAKLHDYLTGVKGSFEQSISGLKNALNTRLIVSVDTVVNKLNIKFFPEIVEFLIKRGVREVDVLYIMPYGNAWKNRNELIYGINKNINDLREGLNILKRNGAVVWTNRLPPEYLEGFEGLIQDPYKILDEIRGRKENFGRYLKKDIELSCRGERCNYCFLKELCNNIHLFKRDIENKNQFDEVSIKSTEKDKFNLLESFKFKDLVVYSDKNQKKEDLINFLSLVKKYNPILQVQGLPEKNFMKDLLAYSDKVIFSISDLESLKNINKFKELRDKIEFNIIVTQENYKQLANQLEFLKKHNFGFYVSLVPPGYDYENYTKIVPKISNVILELSKIKFLLKIKNIPRCIISPKKFKVIPDEKFLNISLLDSNGCIDINSYALDYIFSKKIKMVGCSNCVYNNKCKGIFQKYIMRYGFDEFKPMLKTNGF